MKDEVENDLLSLLELELDDITDFTDNNLEDELNTIHKQLSNNNVEQNDFDDLFQNNLMKLINSASDVLLPDIDQNVNINDGGQNIDEENESHWDKLERIYLQTQFLNLQANLVIEKIEVCDEVIELMELILESVERSAPIVDFTNNPNELEIPATIEIKNDADHDEVLGYVNDTDDVINSHSSKENNFLSDLLKESHNNSIVQYQYSIQEDEKQLKNNELILQNDIDKDRNERLERKYRREQNKLLIIKQSSTVKIQSMVRKYLACKQLLFLKQRKVHILWNDWVKRSSDEEFLMKDAEGLRREIDIALESIIREQMKREEELKIQEECQHMLIEDQWSCAYESTMRKIAEESKEKELNVLRNPPKIIIELNETNLELSDQSLVHQSKEPFNRVEGKTHLNTVRPAVDTWGGEFILSDHCDPIHTVDHEAMSSQFVEVTQEEYDLYFDFDDSHEGYDSSSGLVNDPVVEPPTTASNILPSVALESNSYPMVRENYYQTKDEARLKMMHPVGDLKGGQGARHVMKLDYELDDNDQHYALSCLSSISNNSAKDLPRHSNNNNPIDSRISLQDSITSWYTSYLEQSTTHLNRTASTFTKSAPPLSKPQPQISSQNVKLKNKLLDQFHLNMEDSSKITELELCVEDLDNLSFLENFEKIKKLNVNVNKISSLTPLQHWKELEHLSIKDNVLQDIQELSHHKQLRYLYLDSNQIQNLSSLHDNPELVICTVNNNQIQNIHPIKCTKLQRLELFHNKIRQLGIETFSNCPSLVHLDLGKNQLSQLDGNCLSLCPLLQTLILSQNKLTSMPCPLRLPLLKTLWLSGNKISNMTTWKYLPRSLSSSSTSYPICLPSLKKLFLQDNCIDKLDSQIFSMMPQLIELDISFNSIQSLDGLLPLMESFRIKILNIQDNPVVSKNQTVLNMPMYSIPSPSTEEQGEGGGTKDMETLHMILFPWKRRISNYTQNVWQTSNSHFKQSIKKSFTMLEWIRLLCPQLESFCGQLIPMETVFSNKSMNIFYQKFCQEKIILSAIKKELIHYNYVDQIGLIHEAKDSFMDMIQMFHNEIVSIQYQSKFLSSSQNKQQLASQLPPSMSRDDELVVILQQQIQRIKQYVHHLLQSSPPRSSSSQPSSRSGGAFHSEIFVNFQINNQFTNQSNQIIQKNDVKEAWILKKILPGIIQYQSLYRGYQIRQKIWKEFKNIKYEDDELDEILHGEEFIFHDVDMEVVDDEYALMMMQGTKHHTTMVYGDHIRKRRPVGKSVDENNEEKGESLLHHPIRPNSPRPSSSYSELSNESRYSSSTIDPGGPHNLSFSYDVDYIQASSSPLTSFSDQNEIRISMSEGTDISNSKSSFANEWGISDPRVLATLLKRNQRMKSLLGAKAARELDKNPEIRYQKFLKTAAGSTNATVMTTTRTSGAFGGKPKTMRSVGHQHTTNRKSIKVPAWMVGKDHDAVNDE